MRGDKQRLAETRARLQSVAVDTLVSTVGSNPLPIAVTARLALRPRGDLILVHTPATQAVAEALEGLLGQRDGHSVRRVSVPDSDPRAIFAGVRDVVASLPRDRRVGLDFTGGTKVMSVFAEAALARRDHVSFYLDARTDCLWTVASKPRERFNGPVEPVGRLPVLELEEVLLLHGQEFQAPLTPPDERLQQTAAVLASIMADPSCGGTWTAWTRTLAQLYRPRVAGSWRDQPQRAATWEWGSLAQNGPLFQRLIETLEAETGVRPARDTHPADFTAALGWPEGQFVAWLHGRWLEQHTYTALRQLPPEIGLRPRGASVKTWLYTRDEQGQWTADPRTEFEVDVIAALGYRLWGFSCTTTQQRGLCKTKLFEAAQRVRQLGGDEAQTVLVSASKKPTELELQVRTLFRSHRQPWACGAADLPRLTDWFVERCEASYGQTV